MSKNKYEVQPTEVKLKSIIFVLSTMIDFVVLDQLKSDKFDLKVVDIGIEAVSKDTKVVYLIPLSNIRVMVKA